MARIAKISAALAALASAADAQQADLLNPPEGEVRLLACAIDGGVGFFAFKIEGNMVEVLGQTEKVPAVLVDGRIIVAIENATLVMSGKQIVGMDGSDVKTGTCENVTDEVRWALSDLARLSRP